MISMNNKPPTSPEIRKYKYCKKSRKKMTDAIPKIPAAGQYAQLRRERYENHVNVQMNNGATHSNIAELPSSGCNAAEICWEIRTIMILSMASMSEVLRWV
jgi:hypothetical protein